MQFLKILGKFIVSRGIVVFEIIEDYRYSAVFEVFLVKHSSGSCTFQLVCHRFHHVFLKLQDLPLLGLNERLDTVCEIFDFFLLQGTFFLCRFVTEEVRFSFEFFAVKAG